MRVILFFLWITLCASTASGLEPIKVDPASGFFVDDLGRRRIFHGVNAVEKLPPFYPTLNGFDVVRSLSDIDAVNLQQWGFNVVRLGVLWQGVVPRPGFIDRSYLKAVKSLVETLSKHGIYTIIDMHQDVMGSRFCGEGFANWTVAKIIKMSGFDTSNQRERFAAPLDEDMEIDPETQFPSRKKCQSHTFSDYYRTKEATHSPEP